MKRNKIIFGLSILPILLAGCVAQPAAPTTTATVTPNPIKTTQDIFFFPPTWTVAPSASPTITPTPTFLPSLTLPPSRTPSITPKPLIQNTVQIEFISDTSRPALAYNLLFYQDGFVKIWDVRTGDVEVVGEGVIYTDSALLQVGGQAGDIVDFSASATGRTVAMARQVGDQSFEIIAYRRTNDTILGKVTVQASAILDIQMSPDAEWIAYIIDTSGVDDVDAAKTIYLMRTDENSASPLGVCRRRCSDLLWNDQSSQLVYGDDDGLWMTTPGAAGSAPPQLILDPVLSGLSGTTQTTSSFTPLSWSPSGQYVIVLKGLGTGVVRAVVHIPTRELANLPGTGESTGPATGVIWLSNNSLLILRPSARDSDQAPRGEVFTLSPGNADFFLLSNIFNLPGDFNTFPYTPEQLATGRVGLGLINVLNSADTFVNGVYTVNPLDGSLAKVNVLPFMQIRDAVWTPDASGVLIISGSRVLYVPSDGNLIYSLRSVVGANSCCFQWVP